MSEFKQVSRYIFFKEIRKKKPKGTPSEAEGVSTVTYTNKDGEIVGRTEYTKMDGKSPASSYYLR